MKIVDETILVPAVRRVLHKGASVSCIQGHNNVTLETKHKAPQQVLFTEWALL